MPPSKMSERFIFFAWYPACPQYFAICDFIVSSLPLNELSFSQTGLWLSYLIYPYVLLFLPVSAWLLDHLWGLWALSFHTFCLFPNFLLVCLFLCITDIFYTARMLFGIAAEIY